jgi:hypothetical protein
MSKQNPSKYLVRPDDYMIFEYLEDHGVYQIIDPPTDLEGQPPIPYAHFTYENLTKCGFFPIDESELDHYKRKNDQHYDPYKAKEIEKGTEKEILECMFGAWINNGMPLYGGLSIQMALDYMESLGIDIEPATKKLEEIEAHYGRNPHKED